MYTTKFGKLVKSEKSISSKDKDLQHKVGKRYFDMCEKFKLMSIEQLGEIMDEKRSATDNHAYLNTLREKEKELRDPTLK